MAEEWKQWCPEKRCFVSEGECVRCNQYYVTMGIKPFIVCVNGHVFTSREAHCIGNQVHCPVCRVPVVLQKKTPGGVCCDHIDCKRTCGLHDKPDKCILGRDPEDAKREYMQHVPIANPETGLSTYAKVDGYQFTKMKIENEEALATSTAQFQQMGKEISQALTRLKILHKGNADRVCADVERVYNQVLRQRYPRADVHVVFGMKEGKQNIDIKAGNTFTAWLLNELTGFVSF